MIMRGAFITIEGTEGVGKSTNIELIADLLRAAGRRVIVTREPGGTELGEKIRDWVLASAPGSLSGETEALLMFAARTQHIAEVIRPALERGDWVVCDRFTDATIAYQVGGRGANREFVEAIALGVQNDVKPDCTILLDAPVQTGLERIDHRPLDHFELEGIGFFERVRKSYLDTARHEPGRVKLIDAAQPIDAVRASVKAEVERFLQRFGV